MNNSIAFTIYTAQLAATPDKLNLKVTLVVIVATLTKYAKIVTLNYPIIIYI